MGRLAAFLIGLFLVVRMIGGHYGPMSAGNDGGALFKITAKPPRRVEIYTPPPATDAGGWGSSNANYGGELTLERDQSGQFRTDATVNGNSLPFLVDTGADTVALTIDSARSAGLYVDPTNFHPIAEGAGGTVDGTAVTIDRLEVGGHVLTNVHGMVLKGLGTNLLGQNVLKEMGSLELKGDRMVLK